MDVTLSVIYKCGTNVPIHFPFRIHILNDRNDFEEFGDIIQLEEPISFLPLNYRLRC